MSFSKILIADDDTHISELLRLNIEKEGYKCVIANNGVQAIKLFETEKPDLILLDIMMPEMDGWQVCREVRKTSNVPIIMLTAKGETFDKVLGLELGADDYITKPFDTKELVARVKAVLRRSESTDTPNKDDVLEYENLVINMSNYELKIKGEIIDIPPKELELLHFLAKNKNRVFTREQLLEEVWDFAYPGDSRTVDVHIKRLREKLEGIEGNWTLKTVWGVGYKFEVR